MLKSNNRILLGSTSFLLSNNLNWDFLEKDKNITFSNYGDIYETLYNKNNFEITILIIFLADLINYINFDSYKKERQKKNILKILSLIDRRLNLNKSTLIVSISEYLFHNTIISSKNYNFTRKIYNFFLDELYKLSNKYNNFFILELDRIFYPYGFIRCFDYRNYYFSKCRLSVFGIEVLAKNLKKIINRIYFTNKKVFLLDCDNTIWGGVLGEDGIENIQIGNEGIGSIYYDFQRVVKKIKDSGVLIVLLSKNNEKDVLDVFKKHKSMFLKSQDITSFKINWEEKHKNIIKLSKDLSLGLNSFAFWDDNPIERQKVKLNLKEVDVIEPDIDVANWPMQLLEYEGFSKFYSTRDDKIKTKQYQIREKFIKNSSSFDSELDYLKSINLKPKIIKIDQSNVERAVQLSQKINQFNLRSIRYFDKDIKNLNKDDVLFLIELKDSYGDHGIIGLVHLNILKNEFLFIKNLLLSCRILGRYLEYWILNEIKKISIINKKKFILAEYVNNSKNEIVKKFLINSGFKKKIDKKCRNCEKYIFDIKNNIPKIEVYEKYR